jgi:hypothetical protein
MVTIDMSMMPLKIIGKEDCLQIRGPSRLSKGSWTQKVSKNLKEGKVKRNNGLYEARIWKCAS